MKEINKIAIFEGKRIRRKWDEEKELWYFSIVDIIAVLINQQKFQLARNYWKVLKNRLKKEGSEVVTKCNQLKMEAEDGKLRETVDAKGLEKNKVPAVKGGRIAKNARLELEEKTGKKVVTGNNFLHSPKNYKNLKLKASKRA